MGKKVEYETTVKGAKLDKINELTRHQNFKQFYNQNFRKNKKIEAVISNYLLKNFV